MAKKHKKVAKTHPQHEQKNQAGEDQNGNAAALKALRENVTRYARKERRRGYSRERIQADLLKWNEKPYLRVTLSTAEIDEIVENVWKEPMPDGSRADVAFAELNEKYFVATVGSKVAVCYEQYDPEMKRSRLRTYTFTDFRNLYCNRLVVVGDKMHQLGHAWLMDGNRKEYDRVVFYPNPNHCPPNYYNLWKGFAVEPKQGSWSLFDKHLREVICKGNEEYYRYLIRWMARAVQKPEEQGWSAVCLRGEKGSGKGVTAQYFGSLFGQHFLHITNQYHLIGHFNGHLRDCLFCFVDEGYWAGDQAAEGVLKGLITESQLVIEEKGKDAESYPNRLHIFMATNSSWVVPASGRERRYFVLDVPGHRIGDKHYFDQLFEEMNGEGRAALLYDLLHMDLSDFNVRDVPSTNALTEQKLQSFDPFTDYYFGLLKTGAMPRKKPSWLSGGEPYTHDGEWTSVAKDDLYSDYAQTARLAGVNPRSMQTKVGMQLRDLLPKGYPKSKRDRTNGENVPQWEFPPLDECRAHFLKVQGMEKYDWDENE